MKRKLRGIKGIYWRIRILWMALQWPRQLNLGDHVLHEKEVWILSQGVCRPRWTLTNLVTQQRKEVYEREFSKIMSLSNWWRSVSSGYVFYMTSWFDIWVHTGIEGWMRGCRIWPKKQGKRG